MSNLCFCNQYPEPHTHAVGDYGPSAIRWGDLLLYAKGYAGVGVVCGVVGYLGYRQFKRKGKR